jgi:hypothetical protein
MSEHTLMHVTTGSHGVVNRRSFLRTMGAGTAGLAAAGAFGWKEAVTAHAEELRKNGMSCIFLFMNGGPSQFETFDPKPGTTNGGPTRAIDTAVSGIQIAENWPELARQMKDVALIRSMTNKEGAHPRAIYQMHTGYLPSASVKYPSLGAAISKELGASEFELPYYVSVGPPIANVAGAGFLGMRYAPFLVADPNRMPGNSQLPVSEERFDRRLGLMKDLEEDFAKDAKHAVDEHENVYRGAANLVKSPKLKAFDLRLENDKLRDDYGRTAFGQGCLLARRLVEERVTFIEVSLGGWDTHQDNFERTKTLSQQADKGFATLVADLKSRGLLERTLVFWLGEFGRTPRINPQNGRDHYPRCFSAAIAGGGIKGGQVIGASSADGTDIKSRPVTVADLFCTVCSSLKINARKENVGVRPIKIVDGGTAVKELL